MRWIAAARRRNFNPHSPKGVTFRQSIFTRQPRNFNPHSPKGVTRCLSPSCRRREFQPTLPKGSDPPRLPLSSFCPPYFNPHSPKGVTPPALHPSAYIQNFNPHSPKGVTSCPPHISTTSLISTHTPQRE